MKVVLAKDKAYKKATDSKTKIMRQISKLYKTKPLDKKMYD